MVQPHRQALLIVDVFNDFRFEGGVELAERFRRAIPSIALLREHCRGWGVPVIYVNDNFGQWHSERSRLVAHASRKGAPGAAITRRLAPRDDDYFVIKPQFSGFYATNLQVLLPELGVDRLILTGVAADICILFTAADAHMRGYDLWAPQDAVASDDAQRARWALEIMQNSMDARTDPCASQSLADWVTGRGSAATSQGRQTLPSRAIASSNGRSPSQ